MVLHGSVRMYPESATAGIEREFEASDSAGMERLVALLSDPVADDAYVVHAGRPPQVDPLEEESVPDHTVYLAIRGDLGYFGYLGPVAGQPEVEKMWPVGSSTSPATHGTNNVDYPAGTGLPLRLFRLVLDEFRETGLLPRQVRWLTEEDADAGRFDVVRPG